MNEKPQKLETSLFNDVLQILQAARQRAYSEVNSDPSICYTLCSKLTWSHNRLNDSKQLVATKYMPYLPTEAELLAKIEREKLVIEKQLN